jgi:transposase-like protein
MNRSIRVASLITIPPEIIQQAIWLYLRFTLSFRDVEDLLAERGSLSPTKQSAAR